MFDNDFETAINFYFFLKESEYVFSQFVTTVGKTDPDTGELFLEDNPAFRNYKKKSRKLKKRKTFIWTNAVTICIRKKENHIN